MAAARSRDSRRIPTVLTDLTVFVGAWAALGGCVANVTPTPMATLPASVVSPSTATAMPTQRVLETEALLSIPLQGKTIIFLGSSITEGSAANGESFVEILAQRDGIIPVKEAASGTTLVDQDENSYIPRMKTIDPALQVDAFICQLSTNDASQALPLGSVSDRFERSAFDTHTVVGAIEYIIAYATATWKAPVIFFTNPRYDNPRYGEMVDLLLQIQQKWGIGVIDLWNNPEMNAVSSADRAVYMADDVHPTSAGYREWWTPVMERYLVEYLGR